VKKKRILIVEDNTDLSVYLVSVLQHINPDHDVAWVTTAADALIEIQKQEPDFILADIYLGGGSNGMELWNICNARYPNIPLMMMSGISINQYVEMFSGNTKKVPAFLQKPFSINTCKKQIEAHMNGLGLRKLKPGVIRV
jgi:DNA-binding NtrC family response regulator